MIIYKCNKDTEIYLLDKFHFKVIYPDGEVEYWFNTVAETIAELSRLQKIHDNKVQIKGPLTL